MSFCEGVCCFTVRATHASRFLSRWLRILGGVRAALAQPLRCKRGSPVSLTHMHSPHPALCCQC